MKRKPGPTKGTRRKRPAIISIASTASLTVLSPKGPVIDSQQRYAARTDNITPLDIEQPCTLVGRFPPLDDLPQPESFSVAYSSATATSSISDQTHWSLYHTDGRRDLFDLQVPSAHERPL